MTNEQTHHGTDGMSLQCGDVLDRVSASLSRDSREVVDRRVDRHLVGCGDCREDVAFMRRLFRARPEAPRGLVERVLERVGTGVEPGNWRTASLAAAAVLVLALGVGVLTQEMGLTGGSGVPGWAMAIDDELGWADEDWIVAGAPYLEGVSDETLLALLNEEGF